MTTAKICEGPGCDVTLLRWLHPRFCSATCQSQAARLPLPLPKLAATVSVPRALLEEPSPVDLVQALASQRQTPTADDMIRAEGLVPEPEPVRIPEPPAEPAPPPSTADAVAAWLERHLPEVQLTDWDCELVATTVRAYQRRGRWPFFQWGQRRTRRVLTEIQAQCEGNVR